MLASSPVSSRRWVQQITSSSISIELQPDAVVLEVSEGQGPQPGVLVVADVILDLCAGTVATLEDRDVGVGLVGEDRLEAMPSWSVNPSWPPGCGRSRRTITREPSGQPARSSAAVISGAPVELR
jgi:hypothetical protein